MTTKKLSINDEMLLTCAYRYAIGRHTYVVTLASYIAQKYYNLLSVERKKNISEDIIKCINECLSNYIKYNININYNERNALNDLFIWMKDNISCANDFNGIKYIELFKDQSNNICYNINTDVNHKFFRSESDFDDLIEWYSLAQVFNVQSYKQLTITHNSKQKTITVFKTWKKSIIKSSNKDDVFNYVSWKWEECYCDVDTYVKYGEYKYLEQKYINKLN